MFIPILGEYLTPQIVGGTGGVMIGNLIVNFFQAAEFTRGAAVSLLVAAFIVLLLARLPEVALGEGSLWRMTSRFCRDARPCRARLC